MHSGRTGGNIRTEAEHPTLLRGIGPIPLVLPLLHGASGFWDEIFIFGGIGVILVGLAFLSWRSGQKRKRGRGARRR